MQIQRMFVNDEDTLENCKREINIMKELSGNKNIVRYMAHKVAKLPTGIYEVLVLLEYCSRGHVLDQMNKRLNRGFSEEEVITIFCDVIEAVGCLHSAKNPIGRDFIKKVGNLENCHRLFRVLKNVQEYRNGSKFIRN